MTHWASSCFDIAAEDCRNADAAWAQAKAELDQLKWWQFIKRWRAQSKVDAAYEANQKARKAYFKLWR